MAHVGMDTRLLAYRIGGISTYIKQVVNELEALPKPYRLTLFQSRKAQERLSESLPHATLYTPCHHRFERSMLSLELLRHRLDVFHSPDFIPPRFGARRWVITVHDLTFLHYPQHLTAESRRYYNAQIARAVSQADHVLTVSRATQHDLVTMLNVPESKITVHSEGVDATMRPMPYESYAPVLNELDLPTDGYILHVGTLEPRKNILSLLEAYQSLCQRLTFTPPLVLVGRKGWLFDETQAYLNAMPNRERVLIRENVNHEQLPAVYNGATVLVLPSFYEGFGLPALEAMACGRVPLVSNRSSLPEVVGDVGITFDPDTPASIADALHHALTSPSWREEHAKLALTRAQAYTWQAGARTIHDVYTRLL
jgi:glycosyltransferase involved in cell wall biosynthesis